VRKLLLKLHLWAGLAASLPLMVVAATGAYLVYAEDIERALDPQLFSVKPGGTPLPAQALLERVQAAYPGERVAGCSPPQGSDRSFMCYTANRIYVYLDPYSGRVLGEQHLENGLRRRVNLLHRQLLAGDVGHAIVVATTAAAVFLILTGPVLWWKFKIFGVKWRSGFWRANFDLHSALGLYSAVVFLLLAVTGLLIAYGRVIYPAILRLSGAPAATTPVRSKPTEGPALSLDAVIAVAERTLPGARITHVGLPNGPTGVFTAFARFPGDKAALGRSRVQIDRYSGEALRVINTRTANWGQRLVDATSSIHFGEILGTPTRLLAFAVGLLVPVQVVAGVLIWWKKP
jgi:uncharacterized iron-regulated membrane protein